MRILMLCYEFPPIGGGGSRVVAGLAGTLVGLGHEVQVVTTRFRGQPRRSTVDGVRVERVECVRFRKYYCTLPEAGSYLAAALPKARAVARREAYDIVHAHFIFPDGWIARRLRRACALPYIVTAHGSDVPGYNPDRVRLAHRALAPVWRRVTRDASAIVCPSRSLQALVRARDPELATSVIPYGFDPDRLHPAGRRARRILVVTRMLRRKGVQHLLRAVADLSLDHEIHVVGDGPYLPTLRKMAEGLRPPVIFHGWLENGSGELTRLLETSEIFVLPSERENFPVALLEAMAAGLAVITTEGTGCAEVVGDSGLLVRPGDRDGLREAIRLLTGDPARARALGRAARLRIERELSWATIADRYVALYARHRADVRQGG